MRRHLLAWPLATALVVAFAVNSMCRYPNYPHYRGAGDVKKAESYECRKP